MVPSIRKNLRTLVISLAILVISLPAISFAAATVPYTLPLVPVTDGIRTPIRIALDAAGNFYVTDPGRGGVVKYNPYGHVVQVIKTAGVAQGVAIASSGNLLVSQGDFVSELNNNGTEVRKLGSGVGQFRFANGIAVDSAGFIYVVDTTASKVQVFNASGSYVTSFGTAENMLLPTGIAYEKAADQLAIADTMNGRILFYNSGGSVTPYVYAKTVGTLGSGPMNFTQPQGMAFEYTAGNVLSRMYVVDTYQSTVQAIDPKVNTLYNGTFLKWIGDYGTANGSLLVPTDAVYDATNKRLIVVNGFGNLAIYGIDGGRNPLSPATPLPTITIDTVASNVTVPNITITGTRAAGATITVSTNTAAIAGAVSYSTNTTWSCPVTNLAAGTNGNVITASAMTGVGNPASDSVTIYYIAPPASFAVDKSDAVTKTTPYTFTGTKSSGTVSASGATCTNNTTTWSCNVPLTEGPNTVTFTNTGSNLSVPIILDTTLPVVTLSAITAGGSTRTLVQNVSGVVNDVNFDTLTVAVNGQPSQPVVVTNGTFSFPVALDNKVSPTNTVSLVATDKAGNQATVARTFNFDNSVPIITVTAPADGITTKTGSVTLSGSVTPASNCTVSGGASSTGTSWNSGTVTLSAGLNTVQIVCTDQAQPSKVATMKRTIFYDASKPAVTIAAAEQDKSVNTPNFTVQGTVDSSVVSLASTINGVASVVPVVGGQFSISLPFTAEGPTAVLLSATDGGGNVSSATRTLIYDVTPPAVTVTTPANPASTVSGTVEPGATVVVSNFNNTISVPGTISFDVPTTSWKWTAALGGSYDPFTLLVAATDPAGNTIVKGAMPPDGDLNGSGTVTPDDATACLEIVVGTTTPTNLQLAHGDIGPLLAGKPNPDGRIDLIDCTLILRRASGLAPIWW